ncbi:membrane-bound lytic murein transglycosylase MltF [Rodentibacter caecimuris]|uniref:Membrane-bound lytic murein transglycosylase F n=1 Tax=Rodentibacter caecimuris TaxID=1796644 RepID=A0ABX3KZT7_9PAST|nr:lytic transglycosylase F [Rodentibacter heylii]
MKGLFLRSIMALALFLWAIDMVFPWQKIMRSEENQYSAIQLRKNLIVGTINNPISYFINATGESGLEYELAKQFAEYLGVNLKIKVLDSTEALFTALENHEIDIAAANIRFQPKRVEEFQIGPAYGSASWQLVYRKEGPRPRNLAEIDQLVIFNNSELNGLLTEAQKEYSNLKWQINPQVTQEELLLQVAEGKLDYTIANSVEVAAARQIRPQLAVSFDLTDEATVHWYLASSSYSELQASLLDFMNNALETGLMARLEEKYFRHISQFDYVDTRSYMNAIEKVLPKFQPLFEKYKGELDWRLLAAVAYQESHWIPDATSPTGVRGIMMLTKDTADRMKITDRTDPEQSIKAGSEYLHWLISQIPDTVPQEDRIWYALSAYNMGLGHLLDARRLTKNLGGNPDNWLDVKKNLPLLAEKRYYSNLKYGYARGYEAQQYVENIRRYMNGIMNYHRVQENTIGSETVIDIDKRAGKNLNEFPQRFIK